MLLSAYQAYTRTRRLKKIGKEVRKYGKAPANVPQEDVFEALRMTATKHATELWGVLSAVVQRVATGETQDYGVVSVKCVTSAFTRRLVDAMCDSAVSLSCFNQHKMGAGTTSELASQAALVIGQDGSQSGNATQTHGSSSSIYQSVGTLTAGSAYDCTEHGLFSLSTGGVMLDRSLVTAITLNQNDIVTWTYTLTCTNGG